MTLQEARQPITEGDRAHITAFQLSDEGQKLEWFLRDHAPSLTSEDGEANANYRNGLRQGYETCLKRYLSFSVLEPKKTRKKTADESAQPEDTD